MNAADDLIVLRYGELFLKGANRRDFEQLLERNVRRALRGLAGWTLERGQGRMFVACPPPVLPEAAARLARVFGFSSLSPARAVPEVTVEKLAAAALAQIAALPGLPRTFKVETQRSDKRYPLTSVQISAGVGELVGQATRIAVDLHDPQLVVGVEVGPHKSFVFVERLPGAGGLPLGCEGKVLLLLSGGIDSPVAGHLMQKRGCTLDAIYFESPPYTGPHARDKVLQLARRLAHAQGPLTLHVVRFTEIQCDIRDRAPAELAVVLYRRMMLRLACLVAPRAGCAALATGENLGQVASQTLANLACIDAVSTLPVLRPLIAHDKAETIALARRLGTFELSTLPYDDCCSLFVPKHPATRAREQRAAQAEALLDAALLPRALETVERIAVD